MTALAALPLRAAATGALLVALWSLGLWLCRRFLRPTPWEEAVPSATGPRRHWPAVIYAACTGLVATGALYWATRRALLLQDQGDDALQPYIDEATSTSSASPIDAVQSTLDAPSPPA
jgi:hypothetical protein